MRLELGNMAHYFCAWDSALDDAIDAPADMVSEVNPSLVVFGVRQIDADGLQVGDHDGFFSVSAPE
jgi:hypothetical protein